MLVLVAYILKGHTVPNSYIYVLPDGKGVYSDARGEFKLKVAGRKTLVISHVGYKTETVEVNVSGDTSLRISLKEKPYVLPEILSTPEGRNKPYEPYRINYEMLKETPVFIEPDPIRVISRLPSVKFSNDISSKVSVLNSPPEETVYFLDGIRVFNTVHLGGFSSILDPNQLSVAEFHYIPQPSDIYGLGGSVNIKSIDFNSVKSKNFMELSFISAKAGATRSSRNYYISTSLRGFHFGYISALAKRNIPLIFYDEFLKAGVRYKDATINFLYLNSKGNFNYSDTSTGTVIRNLWGNTLSYMSFNYRYFNAKVFFQNYNFASFSKLEGAVPDTAVESDAKNPIKAYGIRGELNLKDVLIGYDGTLYDTEYYLKSTTLERNIHKNVFLGWWYFQGNISFRDIMVSYGLRTNAVYYDPNFSLKLLTVRGIYIKGLFGITTDHFYGFPLEGPGQLRFYYFMPSFFTYMDKPQRAVSYIFEVSRDITNYAAFVQVVYRKYLRVYDGFSPGEGYVKGVVFGFTGRLFGGSSSLWYSYSKREPKTFMDSPNSLSISYSGRVRGFKAGLLFSYHTGYPNPYGGRYPYYHRLDVFIDGGFKIWRLSAYWNLTVINVYNHNNIFLQYYNYRDKKWHTIPQLPITPSLSLRIVF